MKGKEKKCQLKFVIEKKSSIQLLDEADKLNNIVIERIYYFLRRLNKQYNKCYYEAHCVLKEAYSLGIIFKTKDKPDFKNDVYIKPFETQKEIFEKALILLNEYWDTKTPIKLIGIAISKLHDKTEVDLQMRLF